VCVCFSCLPFKVIVLCKLLMAIILLPLFFFLKSNGNKTADSPIGLLLVLFVNAMSAQT